MTSVFDDGRKYTLDIPAKRVPDPKEGSMKANRNTWIALLIALAVVALAYVSSGDNWSRMKGLIQSQTAKPVAPKRSDTAKASVAKAAHTPAVKPHEEKTVPAAKATKTVSVKPVSGCASIGDRKTPVTVTPKSGDTLSLYAATYCINGGYRTLMTAWKIDDPRHLQAGKTYRIPTDAEQGQIVLATCHQECGTKAHAAVGSKAAVVETPAAIESAPARAAETGQASAAAYTAAAVTGDGGSLTLAAVTQVKTITLASTAPAALYTIAPYEESACERAKELSGGAFYWKNRLAKGGGLYVEGVCWNEFEDHPELAWGAGFYGLIGPGSSRVGPYKWNEKKIAFQAGLQENWLDEDGYEEQWQFKGRLGYGEKAATGGKQGTGVAGVYAEYLRHISDDGKVIGGTFETWTGLRDHASDWIQTQAWAFYEQPLYGDWVGRLSLGPTYTLADHTLWGHIGPEARYMFPDGTEISIDPFYNRVLSSKVYESGAAPNTLGIGLRLDLTNKFDKQRSAEQDRFYECLYREVSCPEPALQVNQEAAVAVNAEDQEPDADYLATGTLPNQKVSADATMEQIRSVGRGIDVLEDRLNE